MAERTSTVRRRGATTPTAPTRLPSTRERRPAMAALAVLLIVGGALASGWLALQTGNRTDYLRVTTEVAQGQPLTASDLGVVSLPEDLSDEYIVASREDEVVGMEATTPLVPGMVLNSSLLTDDAGKVPGQTGFVLEVESVPDDADDGSEILLFLTTDDTEGAPPATAVPATVVSIVAPDPGSNGIGGSTSPGLTTVNVLVPDACGDEVAAASKEKAIVLGTYTPGDGGAPEGAAPNPCTGLPETPAQKGSG